MQTKLFRLLWGNLSSEELKRFGVLSACLMLTIGPYWMLRGIREAVFIDLVGLRWQPFAKIGAFLFIIPLILIYNKLIDMVRRDKLFYIIYSVYTVMFLLIALLILKPEYISCLPGTSIFCDLISWIPGKLFGWFSYFIFESFGAIPIALFWSFVASTTTTDEAKRGYGMIISVTQIGTISGSFIVARYSQTLGLPMMIVLATAFISLVPIIIRFYTKHRNILHYNPTPEAKKKKTGFFEGLRLLVTKPYLLGIFVITSAFEIVSTMIEFQMNVLGHAKYPTKEAFASFYARFGLGTNLLALVFALTGTSFFLRKFGLRFCLLFFPIATAGVVLSVRAFPVLPIVVGAMIIIKGLSYSLNNPSKEILYIPTSKDIKFKAKSWIDAFGLQSIKASGSGINAFLNKLPPMEVIKYATPILLTVVVLWSIIAKLVGKKSHDLTESGDIIK